MTNKSDQIKNTPKVAGDAILANTNGVVIIDVGPAHKGLLDLLGEDAAETASKAIAANLPINPFDVQID